jgi:hypothetical protein
MQFDSLLLSTLPKPSMHPYQPSFLNKQVLGPSQDLAMLLMVMGMELSKEGEPIQLRELQEKLLLNQ